MDYERITNLTIGIAAPGERVDGTPVKNSDWTDVARAISKAKPESADLLRGLYLHDERATRRVFGRLREIFKMHGVPRKLADEAARVTFGAYLAMRPCEHCEARGKIRVPPGLRLDIDSGEWERTEAGWKECGWCGGDGATHVKHSVAMDALHLSMQVWMRLVRLPYVEAYDTLRRWHTEGVDAMASAR